ncbi:MAG: Organic solvent tolerance protein-like protein [Rickettsiaceae bacterium]|jgi:LPS-assembly protein|nr:Organic solvent tolerance protein-like protein [Rickettsiaceae bacterium]
MKKHLAVIFFSLLTPYKAFSQANEGNLPINDSNKSQPENFNNTLPKKTIIGSGVNIKAKTVTYNASKEFIKAIGNIEVISGDHKLTADELTYDIAKDEVTARGNVIARDNKGITVYGDFIILKSKFKEGVISGLILHLPDNVKVKAQQAIKQGPNYGSLRDASYTPCPTCKTSYPLWRLRAKQTDIDFEKERVSYKHAFFEVFGVPIFYVPYLVHPTPNAKAQSGILVPQIQDNSLRVPLYWRPKSNLDVTVTPRIMRGKTIYEGELRHKIESGSYQVQGSILKDDRAKENKNKNLRRSNRKYRYHLLSNGDFNYHNYNYGFVLENSSDKSYMKNYGYGSKPYLTSRAYIDNSNNLQYYTIETLKFQGMRKRDKHSTDPVILPHVFFKKLFSSEDKTIITTLESDMLAYRQPDGTKVNRASIKGVGTKKVLNEGHVVDLSVYLRSDLYSNSSQQQSQNYYSPVERNKYNKNVSKSYVIPEQHTSWKYPLLHLIKDGNYFEIEPQALLVLSGNHNKHKDYLINTDSQNLELKDENIFYSNRYSGIDKHEHGTRASYGIKISSHNIDKNINSSFFLGQLYKFSNDQTSYIQNNKDKKHSDLVGKIALDFYETTDIYYKFAKHPRKVSSEKEEIGISTTLSKLTTAANLSSVKNYKIAEEDKYIRQSNLNIGYKLNDNWHFGTGIRTNLSSSSARKIIDYGIHVTYFGECVKITAKFINNYTSDKERGIKKNRSNTFSIGLRTLNY